MNLNKSILAIGLASTFSAGAYAVNAANGNASVGLTIADNTTLDVQSDATFSSPNAGTATLNFCVESNWSGDVDITIGETGAFELVGSNSALNTMGYTLEGYATGAAFNAANASGADRVLNGDLTDTCNNDASGTIKTGSQDSWNLVIDGDYSTNNPDIYSDTLTFTISAV